MLVELFRRLYGGDSGLIAVSSEIKPLLGALKVSECASTVFILFDRLFRSTKLPPNASPKCVEPY